MDNGFVAVGQAYTLSPPDNIQKIWILKVDSTGCEIADCWVGVEEHGGMEAWPNPATGIVDLRFTIYDLRGDVTLEIYDIFGRKAPIDLPSSPMEGEGREGGWKGWQIDVSALPPGIYLAVVKDESGLVGSSKFVVARP